MSSATSLPFGVNDTAVRTTLAEDITSTETAVDVGEVTNPPSLPFLIAVFVDQSPLREDDMEIMEVTSISGTTLTVTRGAKGTTAQSFSSGDKVFVGVLSSDFVDDPALPAAEKTANPSVTVDYSGYISGPSYGEGSFAFRGAARADDGRIIFAPSGSSNVGIFDPSTDSYTSGPSHGEGGGAFFGAARAGDGRVIFAPFDSNNVGIFDPSTDSYTSGPSHGEGGGAFFGAARAGDGRVIFAPRDSSNVGIFDPSSDSYTSGPSHGEGSNAFKGAARADGGRVIFAPTDSSNVGIFDPSSDSYTSGPSHGEGDDAFNGAARASDGRVIFAPRSSSNVGISGSINFTKDTVPADLSQYNVVHVTRGGDGPIELNAKTLDDGRRTVAYVSVENAGGFDFSIITDGGSGTFKWSGETAPTLASGSSVVSVIGLKQTGASEVTGFAVEQ